MIQELQVAFPGTTQHAVLMVAERRGARRSRAGGPRSWVS
jgi:hypothetical protein